MIYRSTNLLAGGWIPVATNTRAADGTNTWWDTAPPAAGPVFYRPRFHAQ